jgi:hypothetical protein
VGDGLEGEYAEGDNDEDDDDDERGEKSEE